MENSTNSMTPADPGPRSDQREVVEFKEDVSIQEASLPLPRLVSDELLSGTETRFHDIRNIVTRITRLDTINWDSTQLANADLNSYDFPSAITDVSTNIANKLKGFTFFRASVRVRILVNATRAQSGRLLAWFAPFSSSNEIGDRFELNDNLSGKTAFPHVFLNAGVGNVGELLIPYVSYYSHYELPNVLGDMGKLYITVLNPLKSGEVAPSCSVSVFAQFENPQIEIPTGMGLITPAAARAVGQMVDEAGQKSGSRVISSTLGVLSDVAAIATPIPIVGKFMVPVSWALSAASKIAHYAGFSKPLTKESISALYQLPARGFTHADGLDQSVIMGTTLENQIVSRRDVFGSDHDEMDIKFICSHECFVTASTWSANTASGAILLQYPVTPMLCSRAELGSSIADSTLISYVASMFRQWRGSMKYKIQLSKNVFHSGRLRVVFVPGAVQDTNPDTIDFNQCYSKIVDLVNADTIEYTIPFVSNTLWKQVELAYVDGISAPTTNFSTGMVYVEIINKLRNPDIATSIIDFNLYQSSEDVEFAVPDFTRYMPTTFTPSPAPLGAGVRAVAQITGWDQDPGFDTMMKVSDPLFTAKSSTVDVVANSIGEQVTNLRYLTRRFSPSLSYNMINSQTATITAYSAYLGGAPATNSGFLPPLHYISFLYRFFRGSRRFKTTVFADSTRATEGLLAAITDPCTFAQIQKPAPAQGAAAISEFARLVQTGSRFLHAQSLQLNNFIEVSLPYFSNTYVSLIRGLGAQRTSFQDNQSLVSFRIEAREDSEVFLLEAAGDDHDMGWLIGPPRIVPRSMTLATISMDFTLATIILSSPLKYTIGDIVPANATVSIALGAHTFGFNSATEFETTYSGGSNGDANMWSPGSFNLQSISNIILNDIIDIGSPSGTFDPIATQLTVRALGQVNNISFFPNTDV